MPEPAASTPPAAGILQPRRRRGRVGIVLVAVALVLAGRGLGWFGGGGGATPSNPSPTDRGSPPPAVAAPAPSPTPTPAPEVAAPAVAVPAVTDPAATAPTPAAPASESVQKPAVPAPAPPVAAPTQGGIDGDRFASLLSLVAARQQQGELGGALAALQRAAAWPLDAEQRETVRAADAEVRAAVDGACQQVVRSLAAGEVLAAHETCRALLAEGAEAVGVALAAALHAAAPLERLPERGASPWPIAAPLARDRVVRARAPAGGTTGRVVDGRSDQVTLRIETPQGVTFPTLAVTDCEPVEATADEAVELALAALQAGDAMLARLWLCCARLRGGEAESPRGRRLEEILR